MGISFNEIGTDIRTPFAFVEFDSSKAQQGPSTMQYRILAMGQRLPEGTVPAFTPTRITSEAQGIKAFGAGSQLARMLTAHFKNNTTTEIVAVALDDDEAGQKASGQVTFSGTPTMGGTLPLYIAGERVRVAARAGVEPDELAAAVAAAVNALPHLPVTAESVEGGIVSFTARHAGEWANDIDIRPAYYTGEEVPQGLTLVFTGASPASSGLAPNVVDGSPTLPCEVAAMLAGVSAYYAAIDPARPLQTLPLVGFMPPQQGLGMKLTGGSGNPILEDVFTVLDDTHYHLFALPCTDAANVVAVKEELARRWGPLKMLGGVAMGCFYGSHTSTGELGDSHNSPHLLLHGTGGPWIREERNLLLWDGIATSYVDADGAMRIERMVTTYKENVLGAPDRAYLDVETIFTLEYLRFDIRAYFSRKYPRHKLANDGTRYGQGQAIITPKVAKAECVAWFAMMEEKGLVENMAQFKRELIVERNKDDECRLDFYLPPDLVNQLRILAMQLGFRL